MLPEGILDERRISIDDAASSKKRVLERAARLLAGNTAVVVDEEPAAPTTEQVFERLLERERLGSTGLAGGVALPHARMPGIDESRGAFLRLAAPVEFDAMDGEPVDLVFALLVPDDATEEHLKLLARLATLFNDEKLCERLRTANTDEALQILTQSSSTHAA